MASSSFLKTWVKPEVYPLVGAVGAAVGFMFYSGTRALFQPDVFVNKTIRSENEGEMCTEQHGRTYKHSPVREFVRSFYDFESTVSPHTPAARVAR